MSKVSDPYERQHIANLAKYGKLIDEIFKTATQEAAQIGALVGASGFDASRVFSFNDYPLTQKRIKSLLAWLANNVEVAIVNGIETEWTLANNKNSALSRRVFGDNVGRLTQAQYRRYFSTNDDARQAFLGRKEQGLNLSERVWRYAQGFKNDIELGLDVGIRNGLDADAMSRELRQYLKYPDKLFRRVRDEHGNLVLSKRAADFHPGQGVYRSSYKNARRLAATEINMAYRTADYERMQQLDFVVGIEVCLSNNHPIHDICDDLCGRYPKNFKFTGWHPHCRCYVVSILKTEKELAEENATILRGEEPTEYSVNQISDVPDNFKRWIGDNASRIYNARSIPYFMRDNGTISNGKFTLKEFVQSNQQAQNRLPIINPVTIKRTEKGFTQEAETQTILFDIISNNKQLINGTITDIRFNSDNYFMAIELKSWTDRNNMALLISRKEFVMPDGHTINMSVELRGALTRIARGKELTFDQEYAIESLWHELRHAGAVGASGAMSEIQITAMETINQFCARQSYDKFLSAIGGNATNKGDIITKGYGYQNSINNFNYLLNKLNITRESAFSHFERIIQEKPYESIFDEICAFIKNNSTITTLKTEIIVENLDEDRKFFEILISTALS